MRKISYSQITTYIECPYKWYLIYDKKIQEKIYKIQSVFGTSMHQTIQTFLYNYYNTSNKQFKKNLNYKQLLQENLITNYNNDLQKNNNVDFATLQQISQIYEDGVSILQEVFKKITKYFKKRGIQLYGTEIQLLHQFQQYNDLTFIGYIDILLYDKTNKEYHIIDIKTSKYKWDDNKKKDYTKRLQLLLYKYFFAKQKNVPLSSIYVQFLILKRKIFNSQYRVSRIQRYIPPNSQRTCQLAYKYLLQNINKLDNNIKQQKFDKRPNDWNCRFCPARQNAELCDKKHS